jgi:hypothetical protein
MFPLDEARKGRSGGKGAVVPRQARSCRSCPFVSGFLAARAPWRGWRGRCGSEEPQAVGIINSP